MNENAEETTYTFTTTSPLVARDWMRGQAYRCCLADLSELWRRWKHDDEQPSGADVLAAIASVIEEYGINNEELFD